MEPSPSGELFSKSAIATRKLEHISMTLGEMVDTIRAVTCAPLTADQRMLVVEALERFDTLDAWAEALDRTLRRLRAFADDIEDSNRRSR